MHNRTGNNNYNSKLRRKLYKPSRSSNGGGVRHAGNKISIRSFEDVPLYGSPQFNRLVQQRDKYLELARNEQVSGDRVGAENYYQHADHYIRLINASYEAAQERKMAKTKYRSEKHDAHTSTHHNPHNSDDDSNQDDSYPSHEVSADQENQYKTFDKYDSSSETDEESDNDDSFSSPTHQTREYDESRDVAPTSPKKHPIRTPRHSHSRTRRVYNAPPRDDE
jgi:hypothetical protein